MPKFSEDDVLDFMITESLAIRDIKDENDAMKKADEDAERRKWATDFDSMRTRM